MAIAVLFVNSNLLLETIMCKFVTTDRQLVVRKPWRLLALLPAVLFALPAFADTTAADADTGYMAQMVWQQDVNRLDDAELSKIHGKGVEFLLAQPEQIPAVILWDESGKGRSAGSSQTKVLVNVSSATANTR